MKYLLLLLIFPAVLACVVPQDGMIITDSVSFCSDVYYLNQGIIVSGQNITVDCNGAVLKSWNSGTGVSVLHSSNVAVQGCSIVNYNIGLYVRNSSVIFLDDNQLIKNIIGTRFVYVKDSATLNNDISLLSEFEIFESENNILSLTNKPVRGDFCLNNYCNQPRSSVELFVSPESDLSSWLGEQLGIKSSKNLFNWIFGNLQI